MNRLSCIFHLLIVLAVVVCVFVGVRCIVKSEAYEKISNSYEVITNSVESVKSVFETDETNDDEVEDNGSEDPEE